MTRQIVCVLLVVLGMFGCQSSYLYQNGNDKLEPGTIVGSVGVNGVVTFQAPPDNTATPMQGAPRSADAAWADEVAIPIRLIQIAPPDGWRLTTDITVGIYGTNPPKEGEYYVRAADESLRETSPGEDFGKNAAKAAATIAGRQYVPAPAPITRHITLSPPPSLTRNDRAEGRTSTIELVLREPYLKRIASRDMLRVQVDTLDQWGVPKPDARSWDRGDPAVYEAYKKEHDLSLTLDTASRADLELADAREKVDAARKAAVRAKANRASVKPGDVNIVTLDKKVEMALGEEEAAMRNEEAASGLAKVSQTAVTQARQRRDEAFRRADLEVPTNEAGGNHGRPGARASSTVRTLTLVRDTEYRRERTEQNVPIYNITAFPLSSIQTEYLFSSKVERNFYVIGVSLQNTSANEDRLVNTGMIRVGGLALVRPFNPKDPWFSIPVQVAPMSREHVYAILDDEEVNEPRSVVFRTLEFAGTLATAFATGFSAGEDTIKALGLGTGVGIPEGKKLWPDRWPGYRRNVVNYTMPNLLKVEKGTTSPTYFVFFSKTQLQGMILDSQLFRVSELKAGGHESGVDLRESKVESAPVTVAHLSFDSMEVPYQLLRGPLGEPRITAFSEAALRSELADAKQAMGLAKSGLASLEKGARKPEDVQKDIGTKRDDAAKLVGAVERTLAAASNAPAPSASQVTQMCDQLRTRLSKVDSKAAALSDFIDTLVNDSNILENAASAIADKLKDDPAKALKTQADALHAKIAELASALRESDVPTQIEVAKGDVARAQDRVNRAQAALDEFLKALGRTDPTPPKQIEMPPSDKTPAPDAPKSKEKAPDKNTGG